MLNHSVFTTANRISKLFTSLTIWECIISAWFSRPKHSGSEKDQPFVMLLQHISAECQRWFTAPSTWNLNRTGLQALNVTHCAVHCSPASALTQDNASSHPALTFSLFSSDSCCFNELSYSSLLPLRFSFSFSNWLCKIECLNTQYNYSNVLFKQLNTSNVLLRFSASKYDIFYYNARSE